MNGYNHRLHVLILHTYMKPRHDLNQCSQDVIKAFRHKLLRNSSNSSANFSLTEMDLKWHLLRSNYLLRTQNMKMVYILIMSVRRICVQHLLNLFAIFMGIKGSYYIGDCIFWFADAISYHSATMPNGFANSYGPWCMNALLLSSIPYFCNLRWLWN